jgi:cell division protein FtsB
VNHEHKYDGNRDLFNDASDAPVRVKATSAPELPFFEQLADFLRRNALYFLIAGLALLIMQDIFGTHGVMAMRRSQVEVQQIRSDIKTLDQENKKLLNDTKNLQSDDATLEAKARLIGLARAGEIIFKLQSSYPDPPRPAPPAQKY